jgi:hypothetical protein
VLEYELPMESRRPDVIVLRNSTVFVMEFKSKPRLSQADRDQADAYGRDLRCYHRACQENNVVAIAVPASATDILEEDDGVRIVSPDHLSELIEKESLPGDAGRVTRDEFLNESAYRPMPSLVQAARELFKKGTIRPIHRARASTEPAVQTIVDVIRSAAKNRSRNLVLLTGVPGAGKTLVGLQAVHAKFLDDIAVPREDGKPTTPAVFLSGNGPLVTVLQYELRSAGGGGKAFVRGVKDYVKRYSAKPDQIPPEHVLVFDEAQRAWDAKRVQEKHKTTAGFLGGRSEPEHFVEFAERVPDWCVVVGLIGGGQEISVGEEGGMIQWRLAVEKSQNPSDWLVHGPEHLRQVFQDSSINYIAEDALNLDTEIRFHYAEDLHRFVEDLLTGASSDENRSLADQLESQSYHLRITRDLDVAKEYLRQRYAGHREARFGMIASAKDKVLVKYGVPNDFQSTKRIKFGPWYSDDEDAEGGHSCRLLETAVTEFGAQGLELEASLLCWGTDFIRSSGQWSNKDAKGYLRNAHVKDPFQLRLNSYRVLLTRGRDASVVFVPPEPLLDETFDYLVKSGFRELEDET